MSECGNFIIPSNKESRLTHITYQSFRAKICLRKSLPIIELYLNLKFTLKELIYFFFLLLGT